MDKMAMAAGSLLIGVALVFLCVTSCQHEIQIVKLRKMNYAMYDLMKDLMKEKAREMRHK